jgi:hypothetical protein
MKKNQLYSVVGLTTKNDGTKVRWTQDLVRRAKSFEKDGHTNIRLVNLPHPMTKLEALEILKNHPDFRAPLDQAIIHDAIEPRAIAASKANGTYVMKKRGRPAKNASPVIAATVEQILAITKEAATADTTDAADGAEPADAFESVVAHSEAIAEPV